MMKIGNQNPKGHIQRSRTAILCLLVFLSSCCDLRDEVHYFPDDAVRYYNEHDTVKFYCPENDVLESYAVCERDTYINIEQFKQNAYCEYAVYRHTLLYWLYLDSCGSSNRIRVDINILRPGHIAVGIDSAYISFGSFHADFGKNSKFSIDVLDHSYHNVIEMPGSDKYEIPSILFSYEYGVIQIQYENRTYSLVNDEI